MSTPRDPDATDSFEAMVARLREQLDAVKRIEQTLVDSDAPESSDVTSEEPPPDHGARTEQTREGVGWGPETSPPDYGDGERQTQPDGTPAQQIDSRRWASVAQRISEQRRHADVVVISAPPALASGATVLASQKADAWLLCARLGATSTEHADRLQSELAHLKTPPAGVVVLSGRRLTEDEVKIDQPSPRRSFRWPRISRWWLVAGGLAVLALAAVVVAATAPTTVPRPKPLPLSSTLTLPATEPITGSTTLTTDPNLPADNAPLWAIARNGPLVNVTEFTFEHAGSPQATHYVLNLGPQRTDESYAVTTWTPTGPPLLFVFGQTAAGLTMFGYPIQSASDSPGKVQPQVSALVPILAPPTGLHRELSLANDSGNNPDLFVLDRGLPLERPELRIFSARSNFKSVQLDTRVPQVERTAAEWTAHLARLSAAGGPDLVFVRRSGALGHAEVHILLGSTMYQRYGQQQLLYFSGSLPSSFRYLVGTSLASPAIYGVDTSSPDRPRLEIVRLVAPPQ